MDQVLLSVQIISFDHTENAQNHDIVSGPVGEHIHVSPRQSRHHSHRPSQAVRQAQKLDTDETD